MNFTSSAGCHSQPQKYKKLWRHFKIAALRIHLTNTLQALKGNPDDCIKTFWRLYQNFLQRYDFPSLLRTSFQTFLTSTKWSSWLCFFIAHSVFTPVKTNYLLIISIDQRDTDAEHIKKKVIYVFIQSLIHHQFLEFLLNINFQHPMDFQSPQKLFKLTFNSAHAIFSLDFWWWWWISFYKTWNIARKYSFYLCTYWLSLNGYCNSFTSRSLYVNDTKFLIALMIQSKVTLWFLRSIGFFGQKNKPAKNL